MDLIHKALRKMKCGEAAGPSYIIAKVLKSAGEVDIELLTELIEMVVLLFGEIHRVKRESFILNLYKDKGDALEQGSYCSLKLANQVVKLL